MAPKKSVSEDPRKKKLKSKAQRDEAPSLDNTFTSSEHAVRFLDDISRRTVVFGKIVDFPFFANHHIHIRELFEAQGWENFLSKRQIQYTTLIKHFYTHFEFKHSKITSYVKGKSISLSHSTLASILGVPRTGVERYTTNSWVQFEGYDPLESIRQMCGNPSIEVPYRPKIAELTLESRLIYHIIAHNILPRSGSYEYTSYLDLFILWCILNKVKLDLAFYIGWHMDTCVKKKNGALPYGLQITTILHHFGVDLSGEKETRDVSHKDVYGETTMRQMRYEFKDDTWVKKNAPVMEQVDEEAQMDEAEAEGNEEVMQEDQEPPSAPSSSSRVNEDNFQLVLGRLDSMATSIENLTTSFDNFSSMVTKRFLTYDEHFATLETSMEEINKRLINQGI
uniref:Putative plant transposon protein domain-containing protein n=1 Tax=Fagus sylvatica TaxID=28930 RepID=A0A2N9GBK7_FAGSY